MSAGGGIYVPSQGPEDWRWLLASPGKQWRHGFSAMALAHSWESAGGRWPPKVEKALGTSETLAGAELLVALPEHETPLRGRGPASQSDVLALGRTREGRLATFAVEGKVREPFGIETVAEWRKGGGPNREDRLAQILEVLQLNGEAIADLRYQLLHRAAAAVLEARRFCAAHAVMLVHAFSADERWFGDYEKLARALGAEPALRTVTSGRSVGDIQLHLGWVADELPSVEEVHPALSARFDKAVEVARELHASQVRKGTDIPYLAHLLAVTALVLEDGGDEEEAIAALLHDAVEDQGGQATLTRIRVLFGDRVATIVEACSDSDIEEKGPWRPRKEGYLQYLRNTESPAILRVSLADKLHNARAIVYDLRDHGDELWGRFKTGTAEDQLWYYNELAAVFADRFPGRLAAELRRTVDELERLARPAQV